MRRKVLVIGDIMVDEYVYTKKAGMAPEAPVPVWKLQGYNRRPGGAANTAANLSLMLDDSYDVFLCGVYDSCIEHMNVFKSRVQLVGTKSQHDNAITKTRIICDNSIVARLDNEEDLTDDYADLHNGLFKMLDQHQFDAVIVSDYNKGSIVPRVTGYLGRIPLRIVDSKRKDLRLFKGFDILKINRDEYSMQASNRLYEPTFEMLFKYCVVTQGGSPTMLRQYDERASKDNTYVVHTEEFSVRSSNVVDVTGCGDVHTAAMTASMLKEPDVRKAIEFANERASQKVQKLGTFDDEALA